MIPHRLIAVIRHAERGPAERLAEAAIEAGFRAVEITTTVPDAAGLIRALRSRHDGAVEFGVGTLLDVDDVLAAVRAGASFVVSPCLDPLVVERTRQAGALPIPGILTPTEAASARALGLTTVKLFPASTGGPGHLAALRSVYPDVGFVPTGGVDAANAAAWFAAGAAGLGLSTALNTAFDRDGTDGLAALHRALRAADPLETKETPSPPRH